MSDELLELLEWLFATKKIDQSVSQFVCQYQISISDSSQSEWTVDYNSLSDELQTFLVSDFKRYCTVKMSMSKENLSTPPPGLKAKAGKEVGGITDAMRRQKEVFREKLRRVSGDNKQKLNPGETKKQEKKNRRPSVSLKDTEKISKGKSYKSREDRKLKEKDPNSKEIQTKKYVLDSKPGGRNRKSENIYHLLS